jgi:amidase
LYEAGVAELQAGLTAGDFSSADLVKAYFKRIEEVNHQRASLHAVIEVNPSAVFEAQILDEERAFFGPRGPLHGIPILIKDNIATVYGEGR